MSEEPFIKLQRQQTLLVRATNSSALTIYLRVFFYEKNQCFIKYYIYCYSLCKNSEALKIGVCKINTYYWLASINGINDINRGVE